MKPAPTKVVVAGRTLRLAYNNRALYRMGTLPRAFSLREVTDHRRGSAAALAWLWACLVEPEASEFPNPEALADLISDESALVEAIAALGEAVLAATPPDEPKNAPGSTPKPSPASS